MPTAGVATPDLTPDRVSPFLLRGSLLLMRTLMRSPLLLGSRSLSASMFCLLGGPPIPSFGVPALMVFRSGPALTLGPPSILISLPLISRFGCILC